MSDQRALVNQYRQHSTFRLLALAADEDAYTREARFIAKAIVSERLRLPEAFSIDSAFKAEIERALSAATGCYQCGRQESTYERTPVKLKRTVETKSKSDWAGTLAESLLGIALLPVVGLGRLALHRNKEVRYQVVEVDFVRCRDCARTGNPIHINRHPLYEMYEALGFEQIG